MFVCAPVDHSQVGKAVVLVSVADVNDNAPIFAVEYETFVCENSEPGQVPKPGLLNTHYLLSNLRHGQCTFIPTQEEVNNQSMMLASMVS